MLEGKLTSTADQFSPLSNFKTTTVVRINSTHFKPAYQNEPIHLDFFGINFSKTRAVGIFNMWGIQIPNNLVNLGADNMGPFGEVFNQPIPEANFLNAGH